MAERLARKLPTGAKQRMITSGEVNKFPESKKKGQNGRGLMFLESKKK